MTTVPGHRNLAQSVRDRLRKIAQATGEESMRVLIRYANERFLYRLSRSPHRDRFVLKGATLFTVWADAPHRPTRDVDLLGSSDPSAAALVPVFRELCALTLPEKGVAADGHVFLGDTVSARAQREDEAY